MKTICVYIDEGASFEQLLREIARELDHTRGQLRPVMAEDVLDHECLAASTVFIMPGGADLPYCAKLDGEGNRRLRQFVESGGTYVGICAGAYFGCSALAFHVGREDEISGRRELALIEATAVGSLSELGPNYDLTIASASAARIDWLGVGTLRGYYHGGPRFDCVTEESVTVFARYQDAGRAPAGVERAVGAGKAVLVGIHLEMSGEALSLRLAHIRDGAAYRHLATLLTDSEHPRRQAFRDLLTRAGVPLKPSGSAP